MSRLWTWAIISLAAIIATAQAEPTTQPARTMALSVLDAASGEPLEKVRIEVDRDSGSTKLATDSNGHVSVPLPAKDGAYFFMTAKLDGYVNRRLEYGRNDKDPIPDTYTLRMDHGIPIHGKVVDDEGTPIEGARVVVNIPYPRTPDRVYPHERNSVSWETIKTDKDGVWTYKAVPADFKEVELGMWDWHHASGEFYQFKKFPRAEARNGTISLALPRGVPISGVVVDQNNQPIKGAKVIYGGEMASNKMDPQKTDDQGRFQYAAKPGEQVVLTVTAKDHAPELVQFNMTDQKQDVTVNLSEAKALFGRIVGPDDEPIPNAWVFADTWRGHRSLETRIRADKDGKFKWPNAPADSVKCSIDGTASGYLRQDLDLTASDDEIVIHVKKAVHVTGTVVDDETGQPIDVFRIVPGIVWNNRDNRVTWDRQRSQERSRQGKIDYTETDSRPAFAMRIEASGYLPEERKGFTVEQGDQTFDIRLKKAEPIKLTVTKPDGSPAAKAKAYLVLAGQNMSIDNGEANNWSCPEATVDERGKVQFSPQLDAYTIVVTSDDGYAEVGQPAVGDSNTIALQAWGKVQGTVTLDGKPAVDVTVAVDLQRQTGNGPILMRTTPQVYHNLQVKTDGQGKFVLPRVPAGDVNVSRREYIPMPGMNGVSTSRDSLTQHVTVKPGETTTVDLGATPESP